MVSNPNNVHNNRYRYFMFFIFINKTNGNAEEFVYDASYIKLKELSLGYNFSKPLLSLVMITLFMTPPPMGNAMG